MERPYYLVRYGSMGAVGQFLAEPGAVFDRGRTVVIHSSRGTELGEVLIEAPRVRSEQDEARGDVARLLRLASREDLERAELVASDRERRFEVFHTWFQNGVWPVQLLDAEPLLDEGRTVLHYLGPHRLDFQGLSVALREATGLEPILLPVGRDETLEEPEPTDHDSSCGHCRSSGGGCGSSGCGSEGHGCSDCGVKKLLEARR
jgi:cell fate regulator YaaT (PSP1 superfamily)